MKKTIISVLVIAAIVALLALPKIGLFKKEKVAVGPPQGGGQATAAPLQVEGYIVTPAAFDKKLVVTGAIIANESVDIKSEISGKIVRIYFKEGQKVNRGDLLIKIDDDEVVAQLEKQKHNKKLNDDNEFRQRKLLEKEAISQEEYDNALNRLNTTDADIKLLQAQLAKTTIRAPFSGQIGFRYVSEGAFLNPSANIATLYNLNPAKIEFSIPAKHAASVKPDSKIYFKVEADTTTYSGQVYALEPQIDANTRTLKIRATTANEKGTMLPGQFVSIQLVLQHMEKALQVPTEAVVPEQEGSKVFVKRGTKVEELKIQAGERTDRFLEIISGVSAGDTVLTTGILQLKQGMKVQVTRIVN